MRSLPTISCEMEKFQYFENLITTTPRRRAIRTTSVAFGDPFRGPTILCICVLRLITLEQKPKPQRLQSRPTSEKWWGCAWRIKWRHSTAECWHWMAFTVCPRATDMSPAFDTTCLGVRTWNIHDHSAPQSTPSFSQLQKQGIADCSRRQQWSSFEPFYSQQ